MKVIVGVKRVIDYAVRVRVAADKTGVDLSNVKMSLNPFCEIAVEEAVKLKEAGVVSEIVAVSVGPKQATEQIRAALAMGADRGIHVPCADLRTDQELLPLAVAKALAGVVKQEEPGMVVLGKQSIDGDYACTAPMLAGLLGWPQATMAAKIDVEAGASKMTVERETDAGTETIEVNLPCVVSADLRLNTPRYPKLPNIMKAKKKPLDVIEAADLGVDLADGRLTIVEVVSPPERAGGETVADVPELVEKLKARGALV